MASQRLSDDARDLCLELEADARPSTPVTFTEDQRAALADYSADCRADPTGEWLTFDEYFAEWCEARDWERERAILAECGDEAQEQRAEVVRCYDDCGPDELPF